MPRQVLPSSQRQTQGGSAGIERSRLWLCVGLVTVTLLGLASRMFPGLTPAFMGKYPGDALWALMVFMGFALIMPSASTLCLACLALTASCLIELLQLYRAPWLIELRATTMGHLVLGSRFSWLDLLSYAIGILFGALVDASFRSRSGITTYK